MVHRNAVACLPGKSEDFNPTTSGGGEAAEGDSERGSGGSPQDSFEPAGGAFEKEIAEIVSGGHGKRVYWIRIRNERSERASLALVRSRNFESVPRWGAACCALTEAKPIPGRGRIRMARWNGRRTQLRVKLESECVRRGGAEG